MKTFSHANILIYDFKKMTIERFEPYGNMDVVDKRMNEVLEEELTWNTGLRLRQDLQNILSFPGFQAISDENNLHNIKAGDYGGFCLAWCFWYLEIKLKNSNIDPRTLNIKLHNKLNKLNIKYSEYIRKLFI